MEATNNFIQIKEQTLKKKLKCIMQCNKRKLAEMLAMRDMIEEQKNKERSEPYSPDRSNLPYWYNKCKSWSDCSNPHYDCINCPLRSGISINEKKDVTCMGCLNTNIK